MEKAGVAGDFDAVKARVPALESELGRLCTAMSEFSRGIRQPGEPS
jgi:hypothetical protein